METNSLPQRVHMSEAAALRLRVRALRKTSFVVQIEKEVHVSEAAALRLRVRALE